MYCNGACCFCSLPCKKNQLVESSQKLTTSSKKLTNENKEVAIVQKVESYEVTRNLLGKEKVRKIK